MAEDPAPGAAPGAAPLRRSAGSRRDAADSSEIAHISDELAAIREAFDERAPVYDDGPFHRELAASVASFAATSDAGTVLDVATGTGLVLRALRSRLPGARMVGADISPGMLAVAREALPDAEFIEADAAALPLVDASVDLVTCVTALHLIPDAQGAIDEWRRVLGPGGRAVTATFMAESRRPVRAEDQAFGIDHDPFASLVALEATVAESGFSVSRHTEWRVDQHVVLIAELVAEG